MIVMIVLLLVITLIAVNAQCTIGSDNCRCTTNGNCDKPFTCVGSTETARVCACLVGKPGCPCAKGECEGDSECVEGDVCNGLQLSPGDPQDGLFEKKFLNLGLLVWAIIFGGVILCLLLVVAGGCWLCKRRDSREKRLLVKAMSANTLGGTYNNDTVLGGDYFTSMGADASTPLPPPTNTAMIGGTYGEPVPYNPHGHQLSTFNSVPSFRPPGSAPTLQPAASVPSFAPPAPSGMPPPPPTNGPVGGGFNSVNTMNRPLPPPVSPGAPTFFAN